MRATVDRDRQPFFCPHATPGQGLHQYTYYAEECQLLIMNRRPSKSPKTFMFGANLVGTKLQNGRYHITAELREGGFGETFLAEDTSRFNKRCVVKRLKPQQNQSVWKWVQEAFKKEAKTLEILGQHDRIPTLLAYFLENQEFFLVQEFVQGNDRSNNNLRLRQHPLMNPVSKEHLNHRPFPHPRPSACICGSKGREAQLSRRESAFCQKVRSHFLYYLVQ
jgi:Protein tyrosine and serine/threonine kinase